MYSSSMKIKQLDIIINIAYTYLMSHGNLHKSLSDNKRYMIVYFSKEN